MGLEYLQRRLLPVCAAKHGGGLGAGRGGGFFPPTPGEWGASVVVLTASSSTPASPALSRRL